MNPYPFELGVNKVPMGGTGNCYKPTAFTGGKNKKKTNKKGGDIFDFNETQRWQEEQNKQKWQNAQTALAKQMSIRNASPERERQTVEDANRAFAQLGQRQVLPPPPPPAIPQQLPVCPYQCRSRNLGGKKISANNRNNKMVNDKKNKDKKEKRGGEGEMPMNQQMGGKKNDKDNKDKNGGNHASKHGYYGGEGEMPMNQQMGGKKNDKDNKDKNGGTMHATKHGRYGGEGEMPMNQQMGGKKNDKDNKDKNGGEGEMPMNQQMGGKKEEIEMGGGKHKVHTGPRGGKYIVRGGVKVYI
jgi:hypothetical protein